MICKRCIANFERVSRDVEENIASASCLGSALVDGAFSSNSRIRALAFASAKVLYSAIQARATYHVLFDVK